MHPKRRRRLFITLLILFAVAIATALTLLGLKNHIDLFYAPIQIEKGLAPIEKHIRIGGLVKTGSVQYTHDKNIQVRFILSDNQAETPVLYAGILPDLFREGQGIVAEGKLNPDKTFIADRVLAKHDATYMPPEVAKALEEAHAAALKRATPMPPHTTQYQR